MTDTTGVWRSLAAAAARSVGRDVGAVVRLFGRLSLDGLHHVWKRRPRPSRSSSDVERDQLAAAALLATAVSAAYASARYGPVKTAVGYGAGYVATSAVRRVAASRTVDKTTGERGPVTVGSYHRRVSGQRVAVSAHHRSRAGS